MYLGGKVVACGTRVVVVVVVVVRFLLGVEWRVLCMENAISRVLQDKQLQNKFRVIAWRMYRRWCAWK